MSRGYLEDICGDESCFFDKKWDLNLLDLTAWAIHMGQQYPCEFDLIWTGDKCLGFKEDGTCIDWTDSYKILRDTSDSFKRLSK